MGFFSSVFDSMCSFLSGVVDKAKTAIEEGKIVAAKALARMADLGEKVVQTVKEVWSKAKPFLEKIQVGAKIVKIIPGVHNLPWVVAVAEVVDKALSALFALETSPVLQKVAVGVQWAIRTAQHLSDKWLTEAELAEAELRKRHFEEAAGSLNEEQHRAVLFGQIINEFLVVRTRLQEQIEHGEMRSFDHYLRLRAAQRLVVDTNQRLHTTGKLEDVGSDDLYVLQIAAQLLADSPTLSHEELEYLNAVVNARYGKELVPYIFEELVQGWALDLGHDVQMHEEMLKTHCNEKSRLETLHSEFECGILQPEDEPLLEKLRKSVAADSESLEKLRLKNNRRTHYINAAEGLLQALENRLDPLIMELIPDVGGVIIEGMEMNVQWDDLTDREKTLVINFANKFSGDCRSRVEKFIRGAEVMVEVTT